MSTKIFLFSFLLVSAYSSENNWEEAQLQLAREEKNAYCCAKNLSCCKKSPEPTSFEVKAVLIKCPQYSTNSTKDIAGSYRKRQIKGVKYVRSTTEDYQITNCKKKMKITIKIKNTGLTNCKKQYILIDHVFDEFSGQKHKLLHPYAIRIKQEPIMQIYGLNFESMVNAQAKEKVYSKQDFGYSGCNTNPSDHPTCGTLKYNNKVVPFSTGFCCSCGKKENVQMEKFVDTSNFSSFGSPLNEDEFHRRNNRNYMFDKNQGNGDVNIDFGRSEVTPMTSSFEAAKNEFVPNFYLQQYLKKGRQRRFVHKRGGQDCSNTSTPLNVDPSTYHDSTHCLEFSNLWYSVYGLTKPKVFHFFQLQIYVKFTDADNSCKWKDFTKRVPVYISTDIRHYVNEESTVAINYKAKEHLFSLNHKIHKLLIPDTSTVKSPQIYPELKGGPEEYLVVRDTEVQPNGQTCDVAGVGYEAFVNQPRRCSSPRGSCLKNQPIHMWQKDKEAERTGLSGKYFLKFFGQLPEIPITGNETDHNRTLSMYYTDCHTSVLDIELSADNNLLLKPNYYAVLTEVYIDATSLTKTLITAKVFNSGLVSSVFKVSLTKCPVELPASFSNINTKPALIAPQRQHIFNLQLQCALPLTDFSCVMEVTNDKDEVVASRKIRIHKEDRCICIWYCTCGCFVADNGLKCTPFSLEEFYAAGFQGGLPVPRHIVHHSFIDDMISLMLHIFLFLMITLLVMGFLKALVGCYSVPVGLWGLDLFLGLPRKMKRYYESELSGRKVVYNSEGWPINPDTGRLVRNVFFPAEFCINIVFFMIYPFAILWTIVKRMCSSRNQESRTDSSLSSACKCKNGRMVQKRSSSLQLSLNRKSTSLGG